MGKIKSAIVMMTITAFLLSSSIPSFAFGPNETRSVDNFFAEAHILKGSGSGYDLDQAATRLQGIVILIRMMGQETAALSMASESCRFSDVPDWARGYVNYAYSENISNGISSTKFGVNNKMTADQLNTLMLRFLGYDDNNGDFSWDNATETANELSIIPDNMAQEYLKSTHVYTKGDLMDTAFCYLDAKFKGHDQLLIDRLIAQGVITEDLAENYGLLTDPFYDLTTNVSGNEYYTFVIDDNTLTISGMSKDPDKAWLGIEIWDKNKDAERSTSYNSRKSSGAYDIPISVGNLPNGEYYINIYGNDERYNTYQSILYEEVILKVTAGDSYFKTAPAYGKYLRITKGYKLEPEDTKLSAITRADPYAIKRIKNLSAEITKNCRSDYEKALAIHDWVAENIYYDNDYMNEITDESNEAPAAVADGRYAVCVGYSELTKDLLAAAGIPSKIVYGFAIGESGEESWSDVNMAALEENHAWNVAYVDGRWINIDTTWDSTNVYESGKFTSGGRIFRSYFDSTLQYFSGTHLEIEWEPTYFDDMEQ